MKFISLLFIYFLSQSVIGQSIKFQPTFNGANLILEEKYELDHLAIYYINELRFYISDVVLHSQNHIDSLIQKYFLIDAEDTSTLLLSGQNLSFEKYDFISFKIGIDSLTNISGAIGGDLDPTKGMYWTWQSGYINFKLEGTSALCPARNHQFQYHIGGYLPPYSTIQQVVLPLKHSKNFIIDVAVEKFLSQVDMSQLYEIMSPGEKAKSIAQILPTIFSIK